MEVFWLLRAAFKYSHKFLQQLHQNKEGQNQRFPVTAMCSDAFIQKNVFL